jgi:hypothetical protein
MLLLTALPLALAAPPPVDGASVSWTPAPQFAASQVSVGYHTACARTREGGVVCWGERLGVHAEGAAWALGGVSDAEQVLLRGWQLAVRHSDGRVSQWGMGDGGRVQVLAGIEGATSLARSEGALCAVHSGGRVSCWGYAPWLPQREDPTWTAAPVPGLAGVTDLACDDWGCCAVSAEGVSCAGSRGPEGMPAGDRFQRWAAAGAASGRLVRGHDRVCWEGERCVGAPYDWEGGSLGALARAEGLALHYERACLTTAERTTCRGPQGTVVMPPLVQAELTATASCGVEASGAVWCWGRNEGNVLGDGSALFDPTPVKVAEGAESLKAVHWSTCIVKGGDWHCTGDGASSFRRVGPAFGGVGSSQYRVTGVSGGAVRGIRTWGDDAELDRISAPPGGAQVAASDRGTSTFAGGEAGLHAVYSLGEGGAVGWAPMKLPADFGAVAELAAPAVGICARSAGGQVACWRDDRFDQDDDFVDAPRAKQKLRPVAGLAGVEQIVCGQDTVCARQDDGRVLCLGSIGMDGGDLRAAPVELPGLRGATDLASTNFHLCAVVEGGVRCVGSNGWAQLGRPRQGGEFDSSSAEPVAVALSVRAVEVAVGQEHSCARGEDGSVWCWGADHQGQLGRGRPLVLWDRAVRVKGSGG